MDNGRSSHQIVGDIEVYSYSNREVCIRIRKGTARDRVSKLTSNINFTFCLSSSHPSDRQSHRQFNMPRQTTLTPGNNGSISASPSTSTSTQKRKRAAPSTPSKPKAVIDLTVDTPPSKKKGKSSPKSASKPGKRTKRFRDHAPYTFLDRLDRAQTQRMFIVDRKPCGGIECPEEEVRIAGTTGNVYTVHICQTPSCTCPDARKGNQCKHIIYVMHFVLKAPEHLQYQTGLLSSELAEIFAAAPSPIASAKSSSEHEGGEEGGGVKRRPVEGDCPICFTAFEPETEDIVYCKAACGNNIHGDCFEQWAKSQAGREVRCVYCRAQWEGDEEQVLRIVREKIEGGEKRNGEGYVNVGAELGLSGARGTFLIPLPFPPPF